MRNVNSVTIYLASRGNNTPTLRHSGRQRERRSLCETNMKVPFYLDRSGATLMVWITEGTFAIYLFHKENSMFGLFRAHRQGQGKHSARGGMQARPAAACPHPGRGKGQGNGSGRGRGKGRGRGGSDSLQTFRREKEQSTPVQPVGNQSVDNATCPLCKNHCSLNDPGCPKGEALAQSLGYPLKKEA